NEYELHISSCVYPKRNGNKYDVYSRPAAGSPPGGRSAAHQELNVQDLSMSRQDANAAFARPSFLYGGNAAYIEDLYARYESDPGTVDGEWRAFFESMRDGLADAQKNAYGPSWKRPNWPVRPRDELISALDGQWLETEKALAGKLKARAQAAGGELTDAQIQRATRDSIHALMLI